MKLSTKYATAPTIQGINKSIAKFYGGSEKELRSVENGVWTVHNRDGKQLSTMVIVVRGRYCFGTIS